MFSIIDGNNERTWLEILAGFTEKDVYYLPAYNRICKDNGDGNPFAAYYENGSGKVFYPFIERDILELPFLAGSNQWRGNKDITTPYGFGGPLISCKDPCGNELLKEFRNHFNRYCQERKIVSEFIRFHPLLENHAGHTDILSCTLNRQTVAVDLQKGPDNIWENMSSTCRNRIRKARRNQVQVDFSDTESDIREFIRLYTLTMDKLKAKQYYYFSPEYFFGLKKHLKESFVLANARVGGKVIASGIIFCCGSFMNYHLGGSDENQLNMAPNNLLFFETARFGAEKGFKYLHLGGGHSNNDSLHKFKLGFAPDGRKEFWVGQQIHLPDVYQFLKDAWKKYNKGNDADNRFFPIYRA